MKVRPTSITVIAWILIAMGGIALVSTTAMIGNPEAHKLMAKSPIPIPIQYAMTYLGLLITVVAGAAMLKGCNWARVLYVGWGVVGFGVGLATSPMKLMVIPGLVVFAIITFFLLRPKANAYFSDKVRSADDA